MEGGFGLARRQAWAASQFATAELGDRRRTRRLVRLAGQMARNSSGSIPQQTGGGADMKAAYRLFDAEGVTHAAVCGPHFKQTREAAGRRPMAFLLEDTTVLDFTHHERCEGLGPICHKARMRGLHQHNVLAVDPVTRHPLGLLYQRNHRRTPRPAGSHGNRAARRALPREERESYWWIEAIRALGAPPAGARWVHVGDRGEDLFGVYDEARRQGVDWLIRASQDRCVETPGGAGRLFAYARSLPSRTQRTITVRRKPSGAVEDVTLCVAGGPVTLLPSRGEAEYRGCEPVRGWVVRVWEPSPPKGVEPLEWLLCTSMSCGTRKNLLFAAEGYAFRWMIEEFHKCEKTGCQVEMRRLEHVDRLEPLIGLLSVLAIGLLQLKFVAREHPEAPARSLFDPSMIEAMARYVNQPAAKLTVGQFWGGIGRLGGHPGRKGDGPIGWLRAWRGWQSFQLILLGADLYRIKRRQRCG